jgi:DNA-binding beta-propeller fold protein YncE
LSCSRSRPLPSRAWLPSAHAPRALWAALLLSLGVAVHAAPAYAQGSYVNFETIPNRSLALSADGATLFAANTPAGRLEIFAVTPQGLVPRGGVQVGLDPIAVAVRTPTEVWVVNHLSDSVSIVDLSGPAPRVVQTLLVGDEPRDIVFAGPQRRRAFITAARRGQQHPANISQELLTPGQGRADVWVFDALALGTRLGGQPLTILRLFGDKPGGLATTPDGTTVYAGIFNSGNETTVISQESVCGPLQDTPPCMRPGGMMPGGVPGPNVDQVNGAPGPLIGTIVKFERPSGAWRDVLGRDWRNAVRFRLPDRDVFEIDAMATPPAQRRSFAHVGTLNAGMAVHPTNRNVYVANIEAINLNRFLSVPALNAFPNPAATATKGAPTADPITGKTLNGHLYEARVSVLGPTRTVQPRHLTSTSTTRSSRRPRA